MEKGVGERNGGLWVMCVLPDAPVFKRTVFCVKNGAVRRASFPWPMGTEIRTVGEVKWGLNSSEVPEAFVRFGFPSLVLKCEQNGRE